VLSSSGLCSKNYYKNRVARSPQPLACPDFISGKWCPPQWHEAMVYPVLDNSGHQSRAKKSVIQQGLPGSGQKIGDIQYAVRSRLDFQSDLSYIAVIPMVSKTQKILRRLK